MLVVSERSIRWIVKMNLRANSRVATRMRCFVHAVDTLDRAALPSHLYIVYSTICVRILFGYHQNTEYSSSGYAGVEDG